MKNTTVGWEHTHGVEVKCIAGMEVYSGGGKHCVLRGTTGVGRNARMLRGGRALRGWKQCVLYEIYY